MSLALPGSCNIFSSMQNAMSSQSKGRIPLGKGVHETLGNFWWIHWNIATRPTQIAEVIPLPPMVEGHHNASGTGAGRIWFPGPLLRACDGYDSSTLVIWQHRWPQHVISRLVTDSNPCGSITNLDLELAGGLLHLDAFSNCFDICKRTILSKGDNLSTTFWERKGSTSTSAAPAYLLCLFGIHQSMATFQDLTTSLEPPTMSPTHYCKIFTFLGLTCLPHCLTILSSRLVVNFGSRQSTLFQP